ncbi:MAG: hypothetical protein DME86_10530, partial [Verrucomicrobia bacterium]
PRHISVMAQIALSLMLLFAAGLFFRGALKAAGLDPGFVAAGDLVTEFDFTLIKKTPEEARRTIFAIAQRARELPGVRAVAVGTMLPYGEFTTMRRVMSMQETMPTDPKAPDPGAGALFTSITPDYFDAIGVKLLRGRGFNQAECENKDGRRVAIIDEELARKIFPNADAVGQHVRFTQPPKDGSANDMEVVGVVSKHRHDVQNDTTLQRLFVPLAQGYRGQTFLHVRLNTTDPRAVEAMIPAERQMLRDIDPELPVLNIAPFTDRVEKSVGLWVVRLGALLFGVFGGIALLLAVVGVYGVKAYAVACVPHPRDRHPHGVGGSPWRCLRFDHAPRRNANGARGRSWNSAFVSRGPRPRPDFVSSKSERSFRSDHFKSNARCCRPSRVFPSGPARHARQSDHGIAH